MGPGGCPFTAWIAYSDPQGIPTHLFTLSGAAGSRLRVDPGQTGFYIKREFRTFYRFTMADNERRAIRAIVPVNIILFALEVVLLEGELELETRVGGTPGGTWSTLLPIFNRNTMTEGPPAVPPQVQLATGGTVLDVLLNKTADNANFSASVGTAPQDERGVLKARWEERPFPL